MTIFTHILTSKYFLFASRLLSPFFLYLFLSVNCDIMINRKYTGFDDQFVIYLTARGRSVEGS